MGLPGLLQGLIACLLQTLGPSGGICGNTHRLTGYDLQKWWSARIQPINRLGEVPKIRLDRRPFRNRLFPGALPLGLVSILGSNKQLQTNAYFWPLDTAYLDLPTRIRAHLQ